MRVLLVEDEKKLSEALTDILKKNGYAVDAVFDGEDGYDYAFTNIYDVIILDVLLPSLNGFEVLTKLRKKKITTPILMLTALSEEFDKVNGLDKGADDYLAKPFSVPELLARLRALTRRRGELVTDNILTVGNVSLNLSTYSLQTEKNEVKLSGKEFEIARYFFERPNFVSTKDDIISKVWGLDGEFISNNLEAYISFLRKKLFFVGADIAIEAVRGVGYKISVIKGD
ncbi:MAG TPA: response regulator transcription factor [Clostridia bacterium]|nr:response regulator transcription factor [Clostridia bacterium]